MRTTVGLAQAITTWRSAMVTNNRVQIVWDFIALPSGGIGAKILHLNAMQVLALWFPDLPIPTYGAACRPLDL